MNTRRFNFYWSLPASLLVFVIVLGCYSHGNSSSKNNSGNVSGVELSISTAHAVPLYKDIHSACTVDIFYTKGMSSRDILSDPYFSFVRALNFTSLQYSGGSTADHDHVMIGDTVVAGGKGNGYNLRPEDAQQRGESFDALLDGVGTVKFGVDFFNQYCALIKKLNIPADIIANVQSGSLQEVYWKIQHSHAERVIFGMEQSTGSNTYDFADGNAYRKKITPWIDSVKKKFPNVITVIDAAPIWKAQARAAEWNDELQGMHGDEARLYLWDKDLFNLTENANDNLATIDQTFSKTIPQWLDDFKEKFPGKKASVWQWGMKPKTPIYNNMLGCLYIGKFYQFMIDYNKAHENFIGYASFMSLKSLDRGDYGKGSRAKDAGNHYTTLKACGKLFDGNKRVDDLSITGLNGVSGIACEENGKYTLLLINESGTEVTIPAIKINGNPSSAKNYSITSVSAPSLDSYDVKEEVSNSSSLKLKPYSVNVIEF